VLRAAGLVLVAEAVARGIAGLADGSLDARTVIALGAGGALLRAAAGWATQVAAHRIAIEVKTDLRSRLWRRIAAGGSTGGEGSTVVLASEGLDDLDDYFTQSLPAMIAAVATPVIVGLRILGADWGSALVVAATIPLVPVFMILIGKHTQERTDEATGALARLADHLAELARGLPVLVGLGRVADQTRALGRIQREYRDRTLQTLRVAFLSALALELIATLSVALVAVILGLRLMGGTVGLEPALLALILAPEVFAAVREVGQAFHASQAGLSALARVRELLARPRPRRATPGAPGPIRLAGLEVRYTGRERPALARIDATLTGITAVTGPSGSGKSTLLQALTGTLPADAETDGAITGAGETACAPQAPRLFADTPREELALYGADDPAAALGELGLAHVADAAVAEISPGERRRLAVARAMAGVDR
ncbi:MAG: ABC transporter transmembrane domain-containing protein, partial [Microbacterium sp.]